MDNWVLDLLINIAFYIFVNLLIYWMVPKKYNLLHRERKGVLIPFLIYVVAFVIQVLILKSMIKYFFDFTF